MLIAKVGALPPIGHSDHLVVEFTVKSSHGKSVPDGVGGALKWAADSAVATGSDIPNAGSFYRVLVDKTSIRLYFVSEGTVCESVQRLPENISSIAGTMTVHQLVTVWQHRKHEMWSISYYLI